MTGAIRNMRCVRGVFAATLAILLFVRMLAPTGFMPVASAQGVIVTLCSGESAVVDLGQPKAPRKHDAAEAPCAFASLAASVAAPDIAPFPFRPIAASALQFGGSIADLVIHRLAAPPPPALGPPARA